MTLATLPFRRPARVIRVDLDGDEGRWVEAQGVGPGQVVTSLRAGPLGGPLQVRTADGVEMAIDRELAAKIRVEVESPAP